MIRKIVEARVVVALAVACGAGVWGIHAYPVSRDDVFGPLSRQLDRMLNDVFGQDFTDGVKSKANFPPLDAYTTSGFPPAASCSSVGTEMPAGSSQLSMGLVYLNCPWEGWYTLFRPQASTARHLLVPRCDCKVRRIGPRRFR